MKITGIAAFSLVCMMASSQGLAANMECVELDSGEAVCDDGLRMFYRPNPSASFVVLDAVTRQRVIAYAQSLADSNASGNADGAFREPQGQAHFFPGGGSVTGYGKCVSLSAPGVSFMGSGC